MEKKLTSWKSFFYCNCIVIKLSIFHSLTAFNLGNTFTNLGIGPIVLPFEGKSPISHLHENDWNNLNIIGFIGGILLLKWIIIRTTQLSLFIKIKILLP